MEHLKTDKVPVWQMVRCGGLGIGTWTVKGMETVNSLLNGNILSRISSQYHNLRMVKLAWPSYEQAASCA